MFFDFRNVCRILLVVCGYMQLVLSRKKCFVLLFFVFIRYLMVGIVCWFGVVFVQNMLCDIFLFLYCIGQQSSLFSFLNIGSIDLCDIDVQQLNMYVILFCVSSWCVFLVNSGQFDVGLIIIGLSLWFIMLLFLLMLVIVISVVFFSDVFEIVIVFDSECRMLILIGLVFVLVVCVNGFLFVSVSVLVIELNFNRL